MTAISLGIFKHNASFKAVDYNMRKVDAGQAELLIVKNFDALAPISSPSARQYKDYLLAVARSNCDLRQRQFHAAIGSKERSTSTRALARIAEHWLWKMGYEEQPYLIFGHHDTPTAHVHLVSSRITVRGKLIPTHFDVRRGREAMNRLLGIDTQKEAQKAFGEAARYRFSSIPQLTILLNQTGYTTAAHQGMFNIYSENVLCHQVSMEQVLEILTPSTPSETRLNEIRALFNSNRHYVSPALCELNRYVGRRYASKFTGWHSAMVELLEQHFAIKVVFQNKRDELPTSYLIIDHKDKCIYSGAALMPLAEFTRERSYSEIIGQLNNRTSHQNQSTFERPRHPEQTVSTGLLSPHTRNQDR